MKKTELGSKTAKGGFANEKAIQVPIRIKKSEIEKIGMSKEDFEDLVRFKKADAQINSKISDINNLMSKYKKCKCPDDCFEVIVVDCDENFDDRSTIYYHCMNCDTNFAIVDFNTKEILYEGRYNGSW